MMNIAPITEAGLRHVIARVSPEDRAEIEASGLSRDMLDCFRDGWRLSRLCGQVERDGESVALYGVVPAGDAGTPWVIATPSFRLEPKRAMQLSHQVIAEMQQAFPRLANWVHRSHRYALRWLPRLGFVIDTEHPGGPGEQFFTFNWSASNV